MLFAAWLLLLSALLRVAGTPWMEHVLGTIEKGEANLREIPMLEEISRSIEGHTICALGDAAAWPVQGLIRRFRHVMEDRLENPEVSNGGDGVRRR
jgi:NADH dehydrogenase (ubiquinone) flavoprotein 1